MVMEHQYSVGRRKKSKLSKIMKKSSMTLTNVPVDIIIDIFSRLPVETLVRCRSVCKSWCNIINDPLFVCNQLLSPSRDFIYFGPYKDQTHSREKRNQGSYFHLLKSDNTVGKKRKVWKKSKNPVNVKLKDYYNMVFVGSSKGLVCFIGEKKLHIFNPLFLNDILTVPLRSPKSVTPPSCTSYGFGFDESSKSFKVICILTCCNFDDGGRHSTSPPLVLDLRVGNSSISSSKFRWRALSSLSYPSIDCESSPSFVDGAFLFLGNQTSSPELKNPDILSFNLEKETIKIITLPMLAPDASAKFSLFDYNGRIGLLGGERDQIIRVWTMISDDENKNNDMNKWVEEFQFEAPTKWYDRLQAKGFDEEKCDMIFEKTVHGCYVYNTQTGITSARNILALQQGSLICASNLIPLQSSS